MSAGLEDDLSATLRRTIPALEGVRGVAILAVLGHQLCIDGYPSAHSVRLVLAPFQWGWIGVQLFFVLSGFLITGILLATRNAENYWSSFFVRRALRIFPIYYLLLLGTFVIVPRIVDLPAWVLAQHQHQAWYWLYVANWLRLRGDEVGSLGHCWSLSVEEQFYLLWPFAVRLLSERGLIRLCLGVAVASVLLRIGLTIAGKSPELAYELTPARADALTIGALAAIVVRRPAWLAWLTPRLGRATMATFGLLAVIALSHGGLGRTDVIMQTAGYTLLAIASALIIVQATLETARGRGRLASALSSPILCKYGKYSYAIYVVHLPLHLFIRRTFFVPRFARLSQAGFLGLQAAYFVVGSLGLLFVGAVSYRLIEQPLLELKRFFAARTGRR